MKFKSKNKKPREFRSLFAINALLTLLLASSVFAQDEQTSDLVAPQAPVQQSGSAAAVQSNVPFVDDVHGIALGMTVDEVRDKLGKPDAADAATMYFELQNGEQVQLKLDAEKKVMMVAAIYMGEKADAPEFAEVFGTDSKVPAGGNGKIYKLVRYPDAGYWVAYSKLNLDTGPMTIVTIQKIEGK